MYTVKLPLASRIMQVDIIIILQVGMHIHHTSSYQVHHTCTCVVSSKRVPVHIHVHQNLAKIEVIWVVHVCTCAHEASHVHSTCMYVCNVSSEIIIYKI